MLYCISVHIGGNADEIVCQPKETGGADRPALYACGGAAAGAPRADRKKAGAVGQTAVLLRQLRRHAVRLRLADAGGAVSVVRGADLVFVQSSRPAAAQGGPGGAHGRPVARLPVRFGSGVRVVGLRNDRKRDLSADLARWGASDPGGERYDRDGNRQVHSGRAGARTRRPAAPDDDQLLRPGGKPPRRVVRGRI